MISVRHAQLHMDTSSGRFMQSRAQAATRSACDSVNRDQSQSDDLLGGSHSFAFVPFRAETAGYLWVLESLHKSGTSSCVCSAPLLFAGFSHQ